MLYFSTYIFSIIILIIFPLRTNSQTRNLNEIQLNKTIKGEKKEDESFDYYTLKIPNNIEDKKYLLIFTVKEDKSDIKDGEEIFSDPDIYVSKTEKNPKSPETSSWYSERYGNDILSIPSEEITKNALFYIGMYCQFKCKYLLYAYLSEEIEIEIGKVNTASLNYNSSMHYFVKIPENDTHKELSLVAFSPFFKPFKIFMSKNSPSSQNTYPVIPSWTGGYTISVSKEQNNYCTGCEYHFLIQSTEANTTIRFYVFYQDDITTMTVNVPFYDSVKAFSKRCYNISITSYQKENEELIIHMSLFSGNGVLILEGWKHNFDIKYSYDMKTDYTFEISGERNILLNKKDFEHFDNKTPEFKDKNSFLNLCYLSKHLGSYSINAYFLGDAEKMQRYNFIMPGREITSYLKNQQYTKYRLVDFSLLSYKQLSKVTVTFNTVQGQPKYYLYYCIDERCHINKSFIDLRKDNLIHPNLISHSSYEIQIYGEENKCYEIYEQNEGITDFRRKRRCGVLAIISCFTDDNFCEYKIRFTLNQTALLMSPKKTYYSMIAVGKADLYEIIITDPNLTSLVIVLNTATGDAELFAYRYKDDDDKIEGNNLVGISLNNDYIPDVIRITPTRVKRKDIVGKYLIKVVASSFSTYNLYYYTTYPRKDDDKIDVSDVTITLTPGQIITDYFPNDLNYKIYTFNPTYYEGKERDIIKIVLTRINVKFSFKVYLDLDTLVYNSNPSLPLEEKLTGYDWSSDANGELLILPDDKKYSDRGPYYIVVSREQYVTSEEIDKKAIMSFYLGVTSGNNPFILVESIEHSITLTDEYSHQLYWYNHNDVDEPFELNINCLSGAVNVFIDVQYIDEEITDLITSNDFSGNYYGNEEIKKNKSIRFELNIDDFKTINLDKSYFDSYIKYRSTPSAFVYIYISKSINVEDMNDDAQFIIVAKSSPKDGEYLIPGISKKDTVKDKHYKHYIIEEIQKRKGCSLFVTFQYGFGDVYVRIPKTIEKELKFPNDTFYDYKGNDSFIGKTIQIPAQKFQEINSDKLILQILITVKGEKIIADSNNAPIEFTISYSSDPKRINQNIPYYNYIGIGEFQYFTFYFDKKATNIYISLSNMNGDADLYLNYGNEIFPTPESSDWKSSNTGHEYIDFNIDDPFFKKHNLDSLSGYYTLLVSGYSSTSYTLFISSHDEVVYPLLDNNPVICQCEEKGEKCFFRYDSVFSKVNNVLNIEENEIIFTSQFLYGDGELYATIYKDHDLNEAGKKFYSLFPNESNAQFSNYFSNQYNYMKIKIENEKYTEDSVILLTFICNEKTEVSINTASLSYDSNYDYMDVNRENIYYLKYNESLKPREQPESLFSHYKSEENDLLFDIHVYLGSARINVYVNETYWDTKDQEIKYFYEAISDFKIDADSFSNDYHNYIKNSSSTYKKTIYFRVTPMSDVGFYIQLIYDKSFVKIPIGKKYKYQVSDNKMIGYFDINDEYSNIEFSLSISRAKGKKAKVYIRINIINKDYKTILNSPESSYHYQLPSSSSYDYKAETDDILNSLTINMDKLPKIEDKENVFIRALFILELYNTHIFNHSEIEDNTISILLSPNLNHFKRIKAEPFQYYFHNESLVDHNEVNEKSHMDYKIFALDKIDETDNKMIIEISSCSGKFSFSLNNQIRYSGEQKSSLKFTQTKERGRTIIIIDDLKDKHIFLTIWGNPSNKKKDYLLSYMMYYYTTTKELYKSAFSEGEIKFEPGKRDYVLFSIPKIKVRDTQNYVREITDFRFSIFLTKEHTHYNNMESVCYLSSNFDFVDPLQYYRDVKLNKNNQIAVRLNRNTEYYVNILAQNIKTNEMITFKPIVVFISKKYDIPFGLIFFLILFIVIAGLIYLYIKKRNIRFSNYDSVQVKSTNEISNIQSQSGYVSPDSTINS